MHKKDKAVLVLSIYAIECYLVCLRIGANGIRAGEVAALKVLNKLVILNKLRKIIMRRVSSRNFACTVLALVASPPLKWHSLNREDEVNDHQSRWLATLTSSYRNWYWANENKNNYFFCLTSAPLIYREIVYRSWIPTSRQQTFTNEYKRLKWRILKQNDRTSQEFPRSSWKAIGKAFRRSLWNSCEVIPSNYFSINWG